MIAPPIPCPARARIKNRTLGDSAHSNDVNANSNRPIVNSSRRPNRSASVPVVSSSEASVSA